MYIDGILLISFLSSAYPSPTFPLVHSTFFACTKPAYPHSTLVACTDPAYPGPTFPLVHSTFFTCTDPAYPGPTFCTPISSHGTLLSPKHLQLTKPGPCSSLALSILPVVSKNMHDKVLAFDLLRNKATTAKAS